jgi:hypothetical protein
VSGPYISIKGMIVHVDLVKKKKKRDSILQLGLLKQQNFISYSSGG